jgi:hypothetical protein
MAYPNKGTLNKTKEKRSEKAPDWYGDIKIDPEYLASLKPDADGLIVIKLSAWDRTYPSTGNAFVSLAVDTYVKQEEKLPYE